MKPSIVGLIWVMISFGLATVEATCPGKITSGPTPKAIPEPRTLSVHHSDYNEVDSKVVCTWLIQTALPRRVVKLTTMDFSPAGGPGCNSTFLAAFDGPSVGKHLLKRWCTPDEVVTSQGSSLTLRFESDNVTARTQFRVDYVAILPKDGRGTGWTSHSLRYPTRLDILLVVGLGFGLVGALGLLISCLRWRSGVLAQRRARANQGSHDSDSRRQGLPEPSEGQPSLSEDADDDPFSESPSPATYVWLNRTPAEIRDFTRQRAPSRRFDAAFASNRASYSVNGRQGPGSTDTVPQDDKPPRYSESVKHQTDQPRGNHA